MPLVCFDFKMAEPRLYSATVTLLLVSERMAAAMSKAVLAEHYN